MIAVELETELDQVEAKAGTVHSKSTAINTSFNILVDLNLKSVLSFK